MGLSHYARRLGDGRYERNVSAVSLPFDRAISPELAHELRSPLAALIGIVDLVIDPGTTLEPGELVELLGTARADAVHLLALIDRARMPERDVEVGAVVLVDVVRRALERLPEVAWRASYTADRTVAAAADRAKVDQIVTNLLQNVSRYTPTGRVTLRLGRSGSVVYLECSDQGPGIPSHRRERIFDPEEGPSDRGLHVGLATSRNLARVMDGDLSVIDSASGATMRLTLPVADELSVQRVERAVAPRVRVLLDIAKALEGSSPGDTAVLLGDLVANIFDVKRVRILVEHPEGFVPLDDPSIAVIPVADLPVIEPGHAMAIPDGAKWQAVLGSDCAHRTVISLNVVGKRAYLLVGSDDELSWRSSDSTLSAVALVAGLAVSQVTLERDLTSDRSLRAMVLEALPIAVSIWAGDPPRLVDWNAAELALLGLTDPDIRPEDLGASQHLFDVRFDAGHPLALKNAPVSRAIREGHSSGPFVLQLRRADGTETRARTYCSPIVLGGTVKGAVVTAEDLGAPPT